MTAIKDDYICLKRDIFNTFLWHDANTFRVLMTCLMLAKTTPTEECGIMLERGQFLTSLHELSEASGLTVKCLRNSIEKLKGGHDKGTILGTIRARKKLIITVYNYDSYGVSLESSGHDKGTIEGTIRARTEQSTLNPLYNNEYAQCSIYSLNNIYSLNTEERFNTIDRINTINSSEQVKECTVIDKPLKEKYIYIQKEKVPETNNVEFSPPPTPSKTTSPNVPDVDARKAKFAESIRPFVGTYGKDMCNDFYGYWTEMSPHGKKMRFEKETTWCIERRLSTWFRNGYGNKKQLTPEMKATLPDMFSLSSKTDEVTISESLMRTLQKQYNYLGDDGEYYPSRQDFLEKKNKLSDRIQKEIERKKTMQ